MSYREAYGDIGRHFCTDSNPDNWAPGRMEHQTPVEGYEFAQQVCRDLRAGRSEALMGLYNRYQNFFAAFASRRLFDADPNRVDEILSKFWIELLNGKILIARQELKLNKK